MMSSRFVFPVILLLVSLVGGVVFVWPAYERLAAIQYEIANREVRVQREEEVGAELRRTARMAETHEKNFAILQSAVPGDMALPRVYHEILDSSITTGIVLLGISSSEEEAFEQNERVVRRTVSLELSGNYEGLKRFIARLRASERMLNPAYVIIAGQQSDEADKETNEDRQLKFQVDVHVYALTNTL